MTEFAAGLLIGLGSIGILVGIAVSVYYYRNRESSRVRMLAHQYRAMTDSASGDVPLHLLRRPDLIASRMEFRKIESIQAELKNAEDHDLARKLLRAFFSVSDPWVRACAAKALYPLDSPAALSQLKDLLHDPSPYLQIPGIWASGEISRPVSVELIKPLLWSKNSDVQQAAIHSLVQLEVKGQLPAEDLTEVRKLLKEVRYKTDWIL